MKNKENIDWKRYKRVLSNKCFTKEKDWYDKYLLSVYAIEYDFQKASLLYFLTELKKLLIVDGLDINFDDYYKELENYQKELNEIKDNGQINIDIYTSYINKVEQLIKDIRQQYNPQMVVDLYLYKIYESLNDDTSLLEILETKNHLIRYVDDLLTFDKENYKKIYEKYGVLEDKTLIKYIELANRESHKK